MIALRFKRRSKPLRQKLFAGIRQMQKRFQPCPQLIGGLRLRQAAVKDIAVIYLILPQDIVERVRYFKRAVLPVFKDRGVGRKNVFVFLVLAHIRNGAFYVSVQKKPTNLHTDSLLHKVISVFLRYHTAGKDARTAAQRQSGFPVRRSLFSAPDGQR